MGSKFYYWQASYQATDQLMVGVTLFAVCLMFGFYTIPWLPASEKTKRVIRDFYTAGLLGIILASLLAPYVLDLP